VPGSARTGPCPAPTPLLCPGWRIARNGIVFAGTSRVAMTRYRYRGANIPVDPWTPTANSG